MDLHILFKLNDMPIDYRLIDQMSFSLSDAPVNFKLNAIIEPGGNFRLLEDGFFRLLEDDGFRLLE